MEEKNLLKQFMGKFEHDYLLALQQRLRNDRNIKSSKCYLKIGDLVIVKDEILTLLSWKGRVMELQTGNDDVIRSTSVKIYQKNSDKTLL